MKTLSRRTALAAVPALAIIPSLAAVPVLAGQNVSALRRLEISPRLATLIAEYHQCDADWRRWSDALNVQAKAIPLDNPYFYRAHCRPDGLSDSEWAEMFEQYKARYDAHPEVIRLKEIEKAGNRPWDRKGDIADELSVTRAETFADLQAQFDIWLDYYVDKNLDGSPHSVSDMGGPELRFLLRLPSEIARLAGAS